MSDNSILCFLDDEVQIDEKIRVRLSDSVETALRWGQGVLLTLHQLPDSEPKVQSLKSRVGERSGVGPLAGRAARRHWARSKAVEGYRSPRRFACSGASESGHPLRL